MKDKKNQKKITVEVANPKNQEEYFKMIDSINEKFRLLYSTGKDIKNHRQFQSFKKNMNGGAK